MSDRADPLRVYHERQIADQATPVTLYGQGGPSGGPPEVVVGGSSVDLRGLHANRPVATAVDAGVTYWSVDEPSGPGTVYVSDGATWSTLVVL